MQLSTSLHVFSTDFPIPEAMRRCKSAGFEALDFNYFDYQPRLLKMTADQELAWAQKIRAAGEMCGIRMTQMHGPVHGQALDRMMTGLTLDTFFELGLRAIRTAAILGVPWVVFHPVSLSIEGREPHEEAFRFNVSFFERFLPALEAAGVGIAFENMNDRSPEDPRKPIRAFGALPEQLAELVDRLDHPLFGVCWDTGHAHVQGIDQPQALRHLGDKVKATHIQDTVGAANKHWLPFQGEIRWKDIVRTLKEIRYKGDFTYEAHGFFGGLPDELRDTALRHAAQTGFYLLASH
jgi:sugar phosphate isomerase/epimerase